MRRAPGDDLPLVKLRVDVADVAAHEIPAEDEGDREGLAHDEGDREGDALDGDSRGHCAQDGDVGEVGANQAWACVWREAQALIWCERVSAADTAWGCCVAERRDGRVVERDRLAHVGCGTPRGVEDGHDRARCWGSMLVGAARALHGLAEDHAVEAAHKGRACGAGKWSQVDHEPRDVGAAAAVGATRALATQRRGGVDGDGGDAEDIVVCRQRRCRRVELAADGVELGRQREDGGVEHVARGRRDVVGRCGAQERVCIGGHGDGGQERGRERQDGVSRGDRCGS